MHNDRTADSVKVTYWDKARDYAQTTVLCKLPDETADNPKDITLFGCTDYEQAWREGMYLAASNRDRRQLASWKTEMEGYIPTFGDVVWVNHDLLGAGEVFSGVVEQQVGDSLLLSCDITMPGDNWYLVIRDRLGKPSTPIKVAQSGDNVVRLLDSLPFAIEDDPYRERTHFMIGRGKHYAWPVKVTAITPEADDRITIAGCIESDFVHTADQGQVPPPPPGPVPPPPGLVIEGLISTQGGTAQNPVIMLSWKLARGADRYLIELSRDGRKTWQPAGTGMSFLPSHEFTLQPGLVTCRVAAVAAIRGDWAMLDVNAGGEFDKPGKVTVQLAEPFVGDTLKVKWVKEPAAARLLTLVEVLHNNSRARAMYVDRSVLEYSYHWQDAQQDGAGRTLTVQVRAQNAENINGDWGTVTATNPAPAVPNGLVIDGLIDAFIVRADRPDDTDIREFRCYGSQTKGFKPAIANLLATSQTPWINLTLKGTWYFRCAWVDQWGADDLNFSGEVKGESSAVDTGDIQKEIDGINDSLGKIKGDVDKVNNDIGLTHDELDKLEKETRTELEGVRSDLSGLGSDIKLEEAKRIGADSTLTKEIRTVSADLSDETTNRTAAIKTESDTRASRDEALGRRIDTVAADLSTETISRTAAIKVESSARAREDETLASQIRTVASELDDETAQRKAAIKSEETARTSADQSLTRQINTVSSAYKTADADLDAAIKTETTARTNADESLSDRIRTISTNYKVGDRVNAADIEEEARTRATADNALSEKVETFKASIDDNTAAVQVNSKAMADVKDGITTLEAKWGVSLDVNGYCSGFTMNNDGKQAEALFRADLFAVGKPGVESFSFVIDGNKVAIPGNLVAGGTITGDKIRANSIEAGHLKANSVTAGKIAAQAVTAQNLAADVADFMVANIGDGSIDNAKIGNYIQSHDYKSGQSGWQINKNGSAEFQNILARGRIIGSIIEGSFIVEGTTKWYATTEADTGREPRYFTYAAPVIKTISKNHEISLYSKSVDDYRKRREVKKSIYVGSIPIVSANYTGSGTTTVSPEGGTDKVKIYNNVERFRNYKNNISVNISGSMPYVHIERYEVWYEGGGSTDASAYVRANSIKISFTIKKGSTVLSKSASSYIDLTNSDIDTNFKFSGYSVHLICKGQLFRCYFGKNHFSVYVPTNYIIDVKSPLLDIKGNSNTTIDYELFVNAGTTGVKDYISRVREQRDSLGKTVVSVKSQTLERNDA